MASSFLTHSSVEESSLIPNILLFIKQRNYNWKKLELYQHKGQNDIITD